MGVLGGASKVQPVGNVVVAGEDEEKVNDMVLRIAKANHALGLKRPSILGTFKIMITNEWMGLGDKVPTEDFASNLKENFINVGVTAALLLTLVFVSTEDVGDELVQHGISTETAAQVFVALSSVSLLLLFVCVMHCLITFCAVSELNCVDEVITWSRLVGKLVHLHYFFFIGGFISYIMSQMWLMATVLKIGVLAAVLVGFLLSVLIPLYATTCSTQALYMAKIELAQKYAAKDDK